jgi:hypothetical protein
VSPRLNIEDTLLTGKRFERLLLRLGSKRAALGAIVEAWVIAQQYWKVCDNGIPRTVWEQEELANDLIECGLAEDRGEFIYIKGSKDHFGWLRERASSGRKGGLASAKSRREITKEKTKQSSSSSKQTKQTQPSYSSSPSSSYSFSTSDSEIKNVPEGSATKQIEAKLPDASGRVSGSSAARPAPEKSLGARIFDAYADAYWTRYGVDPVRNATVNAQCTQIGKRLGEEATEVVRFYVRHNRAFYVQKSHPIGLMLSDAEALRTEWATGKSVTTAEARDVERKQHNYNVWSKFLTPEGGSTDGKP